MAIERLDNTSSVAVEGLRQLLRDYANHVRGTAGPEHICLTAYEEELQQLEAIYCVMLLASDESDLAGCALLKKITTIAGEASCEMKRLWVSPGYRGRNMGRALTERLMIEARALGFNEMYLDTIPAEMPEAVQLYRKLGFEPVERYNKNTADGVKYFRVQL